MHRLCFNIETGGLREYGRERFDQCCSFGHGGVKAEAERLGIPFLGALPIDLDTRLAGDEGTPIATQDGYMADMFAQLAQRLIVGGLA